MHELFERARASVIDAAESSPRVGPQAPARVHAFRVGLAALALGVFTLSGSHAAQAEDVASAAAPAPIHVAAHTPTARVDPPVGIDAASQKLRGRIDVGFDNDAALANPVIAAALAKHRMQPAARTSQLLALGQGLADDVEFDIEWQQAAIRSKAKQVTIAVGAFELRARAFEEVDGVWFGGFQEKADRAQRLAKAANNVELAIKDFYVEHNAVAAKGLDPGDFVQIVQAATSPLATNATWARAKLEAAKAPGL